MASSCDVPSMFLLSMSEEYAYLNVSYYINDMTQAVSLSGTTETPSPRGANDPYICKKSLTIEAFLFYPRNPFL